MVNAELLHFEANTIYVDRVLYGRRDYTALLFGGIVEEEV